MQNYQEACGTESRVWFEIRPKEGKEFLKWAKSLGCVWLNGEEINPSKGVNFFHFSIHSDGKLANVAMFAWVAKQFEDVPKYIPVKNGFPYSPKFYANRLIKSIFRRIILFRIEKCDKEQKSILEIFS